MITRDAFNVKFWCSLTMITAAVCGSGEVNAEEAVVIGAVQTHQIVSVSMQVSSTGREGYAGSRCAIGHNPASDRAR